MSTFSTLLVSSLTAQALAVTHLLQSVSSHIIFSFFMMHKTNLLRAVNRLKISDFNICPDLTEIYLNLLLLFLLLFVQILKLYLFRQEWYCLALLHHKYYQAAPSLDQHCLECSSVSQLWTQFFCASDGKASQRRFAENGPRSTGTTKLNQEGNINLQYIIFFNYFFVSKIIQCYTNFFEFLSFRTSSTYYIVLTPSGPVPSVVASVVSMRDVSARQSFFFLYLRSFSP